MIFQHKHVLLLDARQRRFNAGPKARLDTAQFLGAAGFRVQRVPNSRSRYWQKFWAWAVRHASWVMGMFLRLRFIPGEVVWCQFPLDLPTRAVIELARIRGHQTVAFVHDIEGLKRSPVDWSLVDQEADLLRTFSCVLSLNPVIGGLLLARGVPVKASLELWDYVCDLPMKVTSANLLKRVVFAGNLSNDKASFLSQLNMIRPAPFELYGEGYNPQAESSGNVSYMGTFAPSTPPFAPDGALGLVWDGATLETCDGGFGAYLRYNTPHKASMYLAMGLPILIWKHAAIAPLIERFGAGLLLSSMHEIPQILATMTREQYLEMALGASRLGEMVRQGHHIQAAVKGLDEALVPQARGSSC